MANAHADNIPQQILYDYNFNPQHETKYERWLLDEKIHVFRFCNLKTNMKIYVKYEEE